MPKKHQGAYFIDKASPQDIRLQPQRYQAINDYCWDHYSYFAHQRSHIYDKLKESLAKNTQLISFEKWARVVSYKYSLEPIAHAAGIEAIVYPSRMSMKHHCLAVFPENFIYSTSFVELEGDTPETIKLRRLDSQTYKECI